jgi:hypothetical protein
MVDARDLKSLGFSRAGSSPAPGINQLIGNCEILATRPAAGRLFTNGPNPGRIGKYG